MGFLLVSGKEVVSPISVIDEFFSNNIDFAQNPLGFTSPEKKRNTGRTTAQSQQSIF